LVRQCKPTIGEARCDAPQNQCLSARRIIRHVATIRNGYRAFGGTRDRDSQSIALRRFSGHLSRAMIRATVRQKQQQFMIVNNSASFQQQIALK
jgi:hypothetical protein